MLPETALDIQVAPFPKRLLHSKLIPQPPNSICRQMYFWDVVCGRMIGLFRWAIQIVQEMTGFETKQFERLNQIGCGNQKN
jgi:hypothetical protein